MRRLIITTVGTSLLMFDPDQPDEKRLLKEHVQRVVKDCKAIQKEMQIAAGPPGSGTYVPWDVLTRPPTGAGAMEDLDAAEKKLLNAYKEYVDNAAGRTAEEEKERLRRIRRISAEVASLNALGATEGDRVVLLASDTVDGASAARCVAMMCCAEPRVLQLDGEQRPVEMPGLSRNLQTRRGNLARELPPLPFNTQVDVMLVEDLKWDPEDATEEDRTAAEDFRKHGCFNLAATISALIRWRERDELPDVVHNITGGLKSSIPFITWIASLAAEKERGETTLAYLYEDSPELLQTEVPPMRVLSQVAECVAQESVTPNDVLVAGAGAYFRGLEIDKPELTLFGKVLQAFVRASGQAAAHRRDQAAAEADSASQESAENLHDDGLGIPL